MYVSKPVANPPNTPFFRAVRLRNSALFSLLVCFASLSALVLAEGPPGPRKPGEQGQGRPFQNGGQGQGRGFGGFGGMRPGPGMEGLTEDEKQRLRAAVEKVWSTPEMIAARDKIMKANEELRSTLREALKKTDPGVVAIMEKVKVPMPWEHRVPPPLPHPDDPDFPRQATARLGFEMMSFAKPEQREALRHLHDRVVELPEVKQAITRLQEAPKEGRGDAFKNLREVYKHECEKAIADYRRNHAGDPPKGGNLASPKS